MVVTPEWSKPARSAASAPPRVNASRMSDAEPAPPDAITGTVATLTTLDNSSRSYPPRAPSRSMLVSRISPAPSSTHRSDHSIASNPVGPRPQRCRDVLYRSHPAANGKRNEQPLRGPSNEIEQGGSSLVRRRDVQ